MITDLMPQDQWREGFEPCCYVTTVRTWIPGELVTANMMNTLRDLFLEIEAGSAELDKATLVGASSATLATMLSDSGFAALAYDETVGSIVASINGEAFTELGGGSFLPADAVYIAVGH